MTDNGTKLLASLTGFTPGPWATNKDDHDAAYQDIKIGYEHNGICMIWQDDTPKRYYNREQRCNAALIVAAPELHRIATEQAAEIERLRAALEALVLNFDNGRMVSGRAGGMTIEANIKGSTYSGVPAWPVEVAREALQAKP